MSDSLCKWTDHEWYRLTHSDYVRCEKCGYLEDFRAIDEQPK